MKKESGRERKKEREGNVPVLELHWKDQLQQGRLFERGLLRKEEKRKK